MRRTLTGDYAMFTQGRARRRSSSAASPMPVGDASPPPRLHYAVGDVHGRSDLLHQALRDIDDDRAGEPAVAVFLGDYVDRGPDSRAVIDRLMSDDAPGLTKVCLMGNHEAMMLQALAQGGPAMATWLQNGGETTCRSYLGQFPPAHLSWLGALPLTYETEHHLFVHAGIRPDVALSEQRQTDLLWIRRAFLDAREDFGKHVVHGHSPEIGPDLSPFRTNLDGLAWRTGRLRIGVFDIGRPGGAMRIMEARLGQAQAS